MRHALVGDCDPLIRIKSSLFVETFDLPLFPTYRSYHPSDQAEDDDVDVDVDEEHAVVVYKPISTTTTTTTTTTSTMTTAFASVESGEIGNYCGACRYYSRRLHVKKYCKRDYSESDVHLRQCFNLLSLAIHAHVINRHDAGQWVSYLLNVIHVYKDRLSRIQENEQWVWVSREDVQCGCPRLQLGRQYLLMGFYDQLQTSLTLDRTSVVIQWRPRMDQRMNRFRAFELKRKC